MTQITDGLLSEIHLLPTEMIDIIKGYIPISVRILLNKTQYLLYHPIIYYAAGDNYVRHIVRDDHSFVFEQIAKERKKQWKYQKKYKYKNNIYKNYIHFLSAFCIENQATGCRNILNRFFGKRINE